VTLSSRSSAYFAVYSETVSAAEMTRRIGAEPDRSTVRGSRFVSPSVVPKTHAWDLLPRADAESTLQEQLGDVLGRVRSYEARIAELCDEGECGSVLRIVREFRLMAEDADALGLALDAQDVAPLARVGAFVDISEYDLTAD
jgi:hypothetical protein